MTTTSTGPKLKRGEKTLEINGGNVVYEILGKEGDYIALTPGGRFSKDIEGLTAVGAGPGQGRLSSTAVGPAQLWKV